MARVDFAAVAERARAAGRSVEQFVAECFEEVAGRAATALPIATLPSTGPSLAPTARRTLDLTGARPPSTSLPAVQSASIDALLIALLRASIRESAVERSLALERLRAYNASRRQFNDAFEDIETWAATQEDAFHELLVALRRAWGLGIKPALVHVAQAARKAFGWISQRVGQVAVAVRERIARVVYWLFRASMRAYGMTAQSAAPVFFEVATTVTVIAIVVVAVVVAVFTFGAATVVVSVFAAMVVATAAVLAVVLTAAFAAGLDVDAIVGAGGALGAIAWAEHVGKAWRAATRRPDLVTLARALATGLHLTAEQMAVVLKSACARSVGEIADALIAVFGRDAGQLARALKAAQASANEIAGLLKSRLAADASAIAQALKSAGFDASAVVAALKSAAFSATDAARAVKAAFASSATDVARALRGAQYAVQDVIAAIVAAFGMALAAAASLVTSLG